MPPMAAEGNPDLISVQDAAETYKIGSASIWRWIASGRLTAHRRPAGRPRVFVDRRELRRLLEPKPTRRKK